MKCCLGIDTSNYTTSAALYFPDSGHILQKKMLLPVKQGEKGLRQSDAVFHHTVQLPKIITELFYEADKPEICAIGVSEKPRNIDGSYMPCFLCGTGLAQSLSTIMNLPVYKTSHQVGHILAALFSANRFDLIGKNFIAFHVSGGTTDCLLCEPDVGSIIRITELATSLDLKAGQAVDRCGVMLGLRFPCGVELEKLAEKSERTYKIKSKLRDGCCSLSGVENKCADMLKKGEPAKDIAKFCLESVNSAIEAMTEYALENNPCDDVVYAGGVMSNKLIRHRLENRFNASFAAPDFSCDNAAGTAIYAALSMKGGVLK